jgi:AcrR family transcriptional regulator
MGTRSRAPSPRWLDLAEQQRAAVVRAIVDLISEGATPLKVGDIAQRAGISRQTFYKYFPTLGAAVVHTAQSLIGQLESFIVASEPRSENARERLLARFSLSFAFARTHPELTRFFSYYDFTFRSSVTAHEEAERSAVSHAAGEPFLDLFRAGQAEGSIDPSLPADVTYLALVTSLTGTSQRLLIESDWTTGTDKRARGVHDQLIEVWRQALTPTTT